MHTGTPSANGLSGEIKFINKNSLQITLLIRILYHKKEINLSVLNNNCKGQNEIKVK